MAEPLLLSTPPQTFGRFRRLEPLGTGGMARVFRAEMVGTGGFATLVALKLIHSHLSGEGEFRVWFINEARLGGYLKHPNIVSTLDFGDLEGQLYLALEYIDGPTLRQLSAHHQKRGESLPLDHILQIAVQVCSALSYAHQATDHEGQPLSMIHRDLKPANILLNRFGQAKVADFGVARSETNLQRTLESGELRGTISYMSPEQALGRRDIDHRADLFSLGVVLHELLTHQRVYTGATLEQLVQAQTGKIFFRRDLLPAGPHRAELEALLRRALEPQVEARFQSAAEMGEAIQALLDRLPSPARLDRWLGSLALTPGPASIGTSGAAAARVIYHSATQGDPSEAHDSVARPLPNVAQAWAAPGVPCVLSGPGGRNWASPDTPALRSELNGFLHQPALDSMSLPLGTLDVRPSTDHALVLPGVPLEEGSRDVAPPFRIPFAASVLILGVSVLVLLLLGVAMFKRGQLEDVPVRPNTNTAPPPVVQAQNAPAPLKGDSPGGHATTSKLEVPGASDLRRSPTGRANAPVESARTSPRSEPKVALSSSPTVGAPSEAVAPAAAPVEKPVNNPIANPIMIPAAGPIANPALDPGLAEGPAAPRPEPPARASGILIIKSTPQARISLEGLPSPGFTPTLRGLEYPAGTYKIRLTRPDLDYDQTVDVEVRAGRTTTVSCASKCEVVGP